MWWYYIDCRERIFVQFYRVEEEVWYYNGVNSYIFINNDEIRKFKAKDSEINVAPLWLVKVSKDLLVENMKKTRLYGYVYEFRIDYVISIDDILAFTNI